MTSQHLWQWQFLPTKQFIIECKSFSTFDYYAFHNKTIIFNFQWPLVLGDLKFWSSNYTNGKKKKANMFFFISQPNQLHCVKSVRIQSYSSPYFPVFGLNTERYLVSLRIQSECGKILRISPYSVRMWENTDQNNSKYGQFLRSAAKWLTIVRNASFERYKRFQKSNCSRFFLWYPFFVHFALPLPRSAFLNVGVMVFELFYWAKSKYLWWKVNYNPLWRWLFHNCCTFFSISE